MFFKIKEIILIIHHYSLFILKIFPKCFHRMKDSSGKFPKAHSRVIDLKNFSQTLPQDEGRFGNFPKGSLIIEENFGKTPIAKSSVRGLLGYYFCKK